MSVSAYNTTQCHFRRPQSEKVTSGKSRKFSLLLTKRKKCKKKEIQKAVKERENERWKNIEADTAEGRLKNYYHNTKVSEEAATTIFRAEELY
jgi:hypothetical protein